MMQRFKATLDTTAKMVSVAVCIVVIIPFIFIGEAFAATGDYKLILVPILIIFAFAFAWLSMPKAYEIDDYGLQIDRMIGGKHMDISELASASVVTRDDLGLGLRAFGSGGAFGYLGVFWYSKAGFVSMHVTDKSKLILITKTNGKKLMISPDETEAFLAAFQKLKA